jgi:hypothetical protein
LRELPTHFWVSALQRRVEAAGAYLAVQHAGDRDRGDILIAVRRGPGLTDIYVQEGPDGFARIAAGLDDSGADSLIARRRAADRDLWVIEIDDRAGRHFLTEPVRVPPV